MEPAWLIPDYCYYQHQAGDLRIVMGNGFWRPLPLEIITALPPDLDGRNGINRAPPHVIKHITANNDLDAINTWLNESLSVPATYRAYRKEIERLLAWALIEANTPFSGLLRTHLLTYEAFLKDPSPVDLWCGPKRPRTGEDWRPFERGLSDASVNQALVILSGCFGYLEAAGYIATNPLALRRKRRKDVSGASSPPSVERVLPQSVWEFLIRYVEHDQPYSSAEERERALFIFRFLYLLAPRLSDLSSHAMNTFIQDGGQWWWVATGKGKTQRVPVPGDMIIALGRYRRSRGLPPSPTPSDSSPLVSSLRGETALSGSMIYKIVKRYVANAAEALRFSDPIGAETLHQASTHWFRHTAITHMLDQGIDVRVVQKQARHSKLETTMIYSHTDNDNWHSAIQNHQLPTGDD